MLISYFIIINYFKLLIINNKKSELINCENSINSYQSEIETISSFLIGMARMLTTIGPENGPAFVVSMFVLNIGTVQLLSICQIGMPARIRACSKVKEQPSAKPTI